MSRRTAGVIFILIAAFLYATYYLCAAIYGSSSINWNEVMFGILLDSVGTKLISISKISLSAGVIYLVWAEIEAYWIKK